MTSEFFNICSLILGLMAWIIPIVSLIRRPAKKRVPFWILASAGTCSLSLVFQFLEIKHRVDIQDWSALMDTIAPLVNVVISLVLITLLLNVFVGLRQARPSEE